MSGGHAGSFSLTPPVAIPGSQIRVLALVGCAFLIAGYDINLLGLVLKKVSESFGVPTGNEGEIVMWARLGVLLAFPLATLADRFGRRAILMVTILGSALTTLLTAFAQNETQFILLQGAVRMFGYAQDMISIVVIAEEIDDRARGWALGLLAASAAVGGGLSAVIFATVDHLPFTWRALYVLGAIPIFAIAYAWRSMPETRRFQELRSAATTHDVQRARVRFRSLMVDHGRRFFPLIAVSAVLSFGLTCATVLLPTFLQDDMALPPFVVTMIYVGGGLVGLVGNFIAGRLADRIGRKPVLYAACAGFVAAMAGLYLGPHSVWLATLFWGASSFAFFATQVVVNAWSAELFPTEQRSTSSGFCLAANIIAGGAALLLQSFLYEPLGGRPLSVALLLPAVIVAALIAWLTIPETAGKTLEEIAEEGDRH